MGKRSKARKQLNDLARAYLLYVDSTLRPRAASSEDFYEHLGGKDGTGIEYETFRKKLRGPRWKAALARAEGKKPK